MSHPNPWRLLVLAGVLLCTGASHAQVTRVGGEFLVNRYTTDSQFGPQAAFDLDRGFVIVWQSSYQDGNLNGIFAGRFTSTGQPLATEFQVNVYTPGSQSSPAVAAFDGGFVVAWSGQSSIFGRRFDSIGTPLGVEFQVNSSTFEINSFPAVAARQSGAFVVAWQSSSRDGDGNGIFARRFDSSGTPVGGDFQANTYTTDDQSHASIAMSAGGGFVVVWDSPGNDGGSYGIFARRWGAGGGAIGLEFRVNARTVFAQRMPSVVMSATGAFVVSWQSDQLDGDAYGVAARQFSSDAAGLATEFQVNAYTPFNQRRPRIGLDGDGDFVVAWTGYHDGSSGGIFARRFDAAAAPVGDQFQVNTFTNSNQSGEGLAVDGRGGFVVAWNSNGGQDGDETGVFAQRFNVPSVFDLDDNGVAEPLTDGLLFLRYLFGFRGATLITSVVGLNCARCTQVPIESYAAELTAPRIVALAGAEFQINAYTGSAQTSPAIGADAESSFAMAWNSPQDGSGTGIFARRFDPTGYPSTAEVQVNDYVTGTQANPAIAVEGDGDFVVAWSSIAQDGAVSGIFGRKFSSAGAPLAPEFQVPVRTLGAQTQPQIALGATGSFVVTWTSDHDGASTGVFARRFDSLGAAQGGEFQVNTYTISIQRYSRPAVADNGDFVVVWTSSGQDGSAAAGGIFGRRFASGGAPLASEFQVNTYTTGYQGFPTIAAGPASFLVAWTSPTPDDTSGGVFAQLLTLAGARVGGEFRVNDATNGSQYAPSVTIGDDGGFIVAWTGYGAVPGGDGSYSGVFARRFDSAGIPRGPGFQVNTHVTDYQSVGVVAVAPTDDFVVAWASFNQDGSSSGLFAQLYHALHDADIDGDGAAAPLTDGLLLLRYLFGFRGDTLIIGVVGPGCTRCTAPQIESYLAART